MSPSPKPQNPKTPRHWFAARYRKKNWESAISGAFYWIYSLICSVCPLWLLLRSLCTHCTSSSWVLGTLLLNSCLLSVDLLAELGCTRLIFHDFRVKVLSGLLTAIHNLVLVLVVHLLLHVALLCGIGCRLVRSKVPSSSSIVSLLRHATLATKVGPSRPRLRSKIAVLVARWRGGSILVLPSVTSCRRIAVLVLCSVGRPINSITKRLSTSAEDREGP